MALVDRSNSPLFKEAKAGTLPEADAEKRVSFPFWHVAITVKQGVAPFLDSWNATKGDAATSHRRGHNKADFLPCLLALPSSMMGTMHRPGSKHRWRPVRFITPEGLQGVLPTLLKEACAHKTPIPSIVLDRGRTKGDVIKLDDVFVHHYMPNARGVAAGIVAEYAITCNDFETA